MDTTSISEAPSNSTLLIIPPLPPRHPSLPDTSDAAVESAQVVLRDVVAATDTTWLILVRDLLKSRHRNLQREVKRLGYLIERLGTENQELVDQYTRAERIETLERQTIDAAEISIRSLSGNAWERAVRAGNSVDPSVSGAEAP